MGGEDGAEEESCENEVTRSVAAGNLSPKPKTGHGEWVAAPLMHLNVDQSLALEKGFKQVKPKGTRAIFPSDRQLRSAIIEKFVPGSSP